MVVLKHIWDSLNYLFSKVRNIPRGTKYFFNVMLIINFEEVFWCSIYDYINKFELVCLLVLWFCFGCFLRYKIIGFQDNDLKLLLSKENKIVRFISIVVITKNNKGNVQCSWFFTHFFAWLLLVNILDGKFSKIINAIINFSMLTCIFWVHLNMLGW